MAQPTTTFTGLVRAPESIGDMPPRHIPRSTSLRALHCVPSGVVVRTWLPEPCPAATGGSGFAIETGSESAIGITRRETGGIRPRQPRPRPPAPGFTAPSGMTKTSRARFAVARSRPGEMGMRAALDELLDFRRRRSAQPVRPGVVRSARPGPTSEPESGIGDVPGEATDPGERHRSARRGNSASTVFRRTAAHGP